MKKSIKTSLIIIALALVGILSGFVWLMSGPDEPGVVVTASGGPAFEVRVEKPRMDRAFGGILPQKVETKLFGGGELRFGHASPGARIGSVGLDRLELMAEGWDLRIETDGEGRIASGTRLVFPIEIAEKLWILRCRPADPANGTLQAAPRAGSDLLDGRFVIELASCEEAGTGEILDTEAGGNAGDAWPSSPLTLRGSFAGLTPRRP